MTHEYGVRNVEKFLGLRSTILPGPSLRACARAPRNTSSFRRKPDKRIARRTAEGWPEGRAKRVIHLDFDVYASRAKRYRLAPG